RLPGSVVAPAPGGNRARSRPGGRGPGGAPVHQPIAFASGLSGRGSGVAGRRRFRGPGPAAGDGPPGTGGPQPAARPPLLGPGGGGAGGDRRVGSHPDRLLGGRAGAVGFGSGPLAPPCLWPAGGDGRPDQRGGGPLARGRALVSPPAARWGGPSDPGGSAAPAAGPPGAAAPAAGAPDTPGSLLCSGPTGASAGGGGRSLGGDGGTLSARDPHPGPGGGSDGGDRRVSDPPAAGGRPPAGRQRPNGRDLAGGGRLPRFFATLGFRGAVKEAEP